MANLVVNATNGINGAGFSIAAMAALAFDNPQIQTFTPTFVKVNFDGALSIELTGSGFGFDITGVTGTATQLVLLQNGSPAVTMSGFSIAASTVYDAVQAGDYQGLANTLFGGADTMTGSQQTDTLFGLGGNDVLNGLGGSDSLDGGTGNDDLREGDGNGVLRGGAGADTLNGGAGIDTATYTEAGVGVTVNLATGTGVGGNAQGDVLIAIENVNGSQGSDSLTGNAGANVLQGFGGNDTLRGGAGADRLIGGAGIDTVTYTDSATGVVVSLTSHGGGGGAAGDYVEAENVNGSAFADALYGDNGANVLNGWAGKDILEGRGGADRFVFSATAHSAVGANADRITDFSHAQADRIDLSAIDANTGAAGDQAFSFIGTAAFTGVAGQLHYAVSGGTTTIAGDVNGDKVADFEIVLTGAVALVGGDFVL